MLSYWSYRSSSTYVSANALFRQFDIDIWSRSLGLLTNLLTYYLLWSVESSGEHMDKTSTKAGTKTRHFQVLVRESLSYLVFVFGLNNIYQTFERKKTEWIRKLSSVIEKKDERGVKNWHREAVTSTSY